MKVTHCDVGVCSCNGPALPQDSSFQAAGACPQLHPHRRWLQVRNLACSETICSLIAWLCVMRRAEPVVQIPDVATKLPLCFLTCWCWFLCCRIAADRHAWLLLLRLCLVPCRLCYVCCCFLRCTTVVGRHALLLLACWCMLVVYS